MNEEALEAWLASEPEDTRDRLAMAHELAGLRRGIIRWKRTAADLGSRGQSAEATRAKAEVEAAQAAYREVVARLRHLDASR